MRKINIIASLVLIGGVILMVGCSHPPPVTPTSGFNIQTYARNPTTGTTLPSAAFVRGDFQSANGTTSGTVTTFSMSTAGGALTSVITGAKVPANWRFALSPTFDGTSLCRATTILDRSVSLGGTEVLPCVANFAGFTAIPNSIDALNPPATITFTGKAISALTGTPVLTFYNEFGQVAASTLSAQLTYNFAGEPEGLAVSVPINISQAYDGVYNVAVNNVKSDGSLEIIGAATITIYGNPPPPPPPNGGDGCGGGQQNSLIELPSCP
jgi:hypothetical protein